MTRILTILSVMALLGACTSGGDETGGGTGATVSITTLTLDQGNVDKTFFQQILATGGRQPYTWWVSASGDALPDGLAMTPDGRIAGSPTSAASASVVVVVQDTNSALDLVTLSIEVRDVEIAGATGESLPFGAQLQLQAAGGAPGYAFSFSSNQSGAQLTGNGDYTAGQDSGITTPGR